MLQSIVVNMTCSNIVKWKLVCMQLYFVFDDEYLAKDVNLGYNLLVQEQPQS